VKKITAALAAFFIALTLISAPTSAMDRTQHLTGLNPPSTWMNMEQRDVRIGSGAFWWNTLCGSNASCTGLYSNLSVVPVTGLFVAVGPTSTNTVGTLYQLLAEETSGYGGYPSGVGTFLPTDATKVMLQGTSTANTANIGPLTAGSSGGQSVDNLIECQVQTVDTTSQAINIVSPGGSVTATTGNRDRKDIIACQNKAGTSATTGSQTVPTVDAGWVAIGYVAVANGTVTITSGMITALATQQFYGFTPASALGSNPVLLSPSSQQTGSINVSSSITAGTNLLFGSAGISALPNAPSVNAGVNLNLNTTTGQNVSFGSGAAQALLFGTISASGLQVAPTINGGNTLAFVPPVYTSTGATYSTGIMHMVKGQVTAVGATTTITLSGAAAFSTNDFFIGVFDASAAVSNPNVTLISTSSFSFASTNTHVYNWFAFGQ
jgi:hypothetical protein